MQNPITEPDIHGLVPPLLACLSTASVSPQPPPALVSLLSPVLAQRLQLLSDDAQNGGTWPSLLCWDDSRAQVLSDVIKSTSLEPHPVSGEIEFQCEAGTLFRRLDDETLQAKVVLEEPPVKIIYVWCASSDVGASGWKVNGLDVVDDAEDEGRSGWSAILAQTDMASSTVPASTPDADDGYWDQYDAKLERTASNETPSGPSAPILGAGPERTLSDDAFYAQYEDVEPALDDPDPPRSDDRQGLAQGRTPTTDQGTGHVPEQLEIRDALDPSYPDPTSSSVGLNAKLDPTDGPESGGQPGSLQPQGSAPPSLVTVRDNVEEHIRHTIRNLRDLATAVGIRASEFEAIVKMELAS